MKPLRILHVVGGMNRAGVETWLMNVLRRIDRERFRFDFLVHSEQPCDYDDEARSLGAKIIPCLHPSHPLVYARNFKRILREHGPYDVVHSHVHHYSGFTLRLAAEADVPVRIAHCHSDTTKAEKNAGMVRRTYLAWMKRWIRNHATVGLAASRQAAPSLFGPEWANDPRWRTLYCGIDLAPFREPVDRAACRAELNLPADALVIGHVGRFAYQKNHSLIIKVGEEMIRKNPNVHILLVGNGPLRTEIESQACATGFFSHFHFAGVRGDVPRLMCGAMDFFIFPSINEGLGLVLVEAQAAGLSCIVSDSIPKEAIIIPSLVRTVSLNANSSTWASTFQCASRNIIKRSNALKLIENSQLNLEVSMERLQALYIGFFTENMKVQAAGALSQINS